MDILNLDAFAKVKRQVTLGGKQHDVLEVTVQMFADNLEAAKKLEAEHADGVPFGAGLKLSVEQIQRAIPSIDEAQIRGLPFDAMTALMQFIRGELDPAAVAAPEGGAAPAGQEGADAKKA